MSSSSSLSALYVRDGRGRYQRAEADQILEAARRLVDQRLQRGVTLSDPSVAKEFLRLRMATLEHEVFVAILLDTRHRVLEFVELFRGTIDGAEVHTREVVKTALTANAAAMIIANTQPPGCAERDAGALPVPPPLPEAMARHYSMFLLHFGLCPAVGCLGG